VKGAARPREALRKMGRSQPLRLVVDRRVHAEELIRFEADVVRGPGADDCAIWVAAVGADGYGSLPSQGHGPIGTWANQIGWYRPCADAGSSGVGGARVRPHPSGAASGEAKTQTPQGDAA
jgi:hypothetical protein